MPGGGATRAKARLHARVHGHRCYCLVRAHCRLAVMPLPSTPYRGTSPTDYLLIGSASSHLAIPLTAYADADALDPAVAIKSLSGGAGGV